MGARAALHGRRKKGAICRHGWLPTVSAATAPSSPAGRKRGFFPILQSQPGFKAYSVAIGDGEVLSLSVWETRADAEAGSEVVASWVAENMDEIDLISVRYAEIMFSTTLGISTSAGATA